MIVLEAPATISEWIRTYKVSSSILTDKDNEIQMYFPIDKQDLLVELSALEFSFSGYSRTLEVYPIITNSYGSKHTGNCILVAKFEFGLFKMTQVAKTIIAPDVFLMNQKNCEPKDIYSFASKVIKSAKFLTAVSDNSVVLDRLDITVNSDNYREEDQFLEAWDQLEIDNFIDDLFGDSDYHY